MNKIITFYIFKEPIQLIIIFLNNYSKNNYIFLNFIKKTQNKLIRPSLTFVMNSIKN
jgi:hypothetical protein